MTRIKEIGHVVLYVRDPEASAKWYCEVLGMEVVVEQTRFPGYFLSFGRRDQDVALFQHRGEGPLGKRDFNHIAFELDGGVDDLKSFRRRLVDQRVTITGTVDHGIFYGVYFLDPDGHQLEVFCQRTKPDEDRRQAFRATGAKSVAIDLEDTGASGYDSATGDTILALECVDSEPTPTPLSGWCSRHTRQLAPAETAAGLVYSREPAMVGSLAAGGRHAPSAKHHILFARDLARPRFGPVGRLVGCI